MKYLTLVERLDPILSSTAAEALNHGGRLPTVYAQASESSTVVASFWKTNLLTTGSGLSLTIQVHSQISSKRHPILLMEISSQSAFRWPRWGAGFRQYSQGLSAWPTEPWTCCTLPSNPRTPELFSEHVIHTVMSQAVVFGSGNPGW